MPLQRRLPKRGFRSPNRRQYAVVNLSKLEKHFDVGGTVDPDSLAMTGLVRKGVEVKILGSGTLTKALHVKAHGFSQCARERIKGAGGSIEDLNRA